MAKKEKGFIPLYRDIKDHWTWKADDPFDIRSAWIDILLSVNHKEDKISIGRQVVVIKPGQMWTSYKKLAGKWHWSYKRVLRYITMLKSDGMIDVWGTPNGTLLTVKNWAFFNTRGYTRDTPNDTSDDTPGATPDDTPSAIQTISINNGNNVKNVNIKDPSVCPGYGWYWHEAKQKWIAPPKEGGEWQ